MIRRRRRKKKRRKRKRKKKRRKRKRKKRKKSMMMLRECVAGVCVHLCVAPASESETARVSMILCSVAGVSVVVPRTTERPLSVQLVGTTSQLASHPPV
jgi:hypothetical protein